MYWLSISDWSLQSKSVEPHWIEAFAVLASLDYSHWLPVRPEGFDLYTDHNKLIILFNVVAVITDLSQAAIHEVQRWAVEISIYSCLWVHIFGAENFCADVPIRWTAPLTTRRLVTILLLPTTFQDSDWPSLSRIGTSQSSTAKTRSTRQVKRNNGWRDANSNAI